MLFFFRFFDKTKNVWSERKDFEKVAGKYDMLYLDYNTTTEVHAHEYFMKFFFYDKTQF